MKRALAEKEDRVAKRAPVASAPEHPFRGIVDDDDIDVEED